MAGEFDPAIQRLVADIDEVEATLLNKKRMVNQLCDYAGRPHMYADAQLIVGAGAGLIRPDQFYGQPLASAIRFYLEMRFARGQGAATVREIFDALKQGGFKFETKDDANAERGLRQSLTKNSVTFHKLPNGTYGLLEWYPNAKPAKPDETEARNGKNKPADDVSSSTGSATSSDASLNREEEDASDTLEEGR
ncbi:hypothetical protein [Mesorhizobium sp. f-mel]